MWKRFPVVLAVILAFVITIPALSTGFGSESDEIEEPPTRYGFTTTWYDIASPSSMSYCVATGDLDNANNDDIVAGQNEAITIYTNNGGSTISFSLKQTLPFTGYYIMDLEIVDYDNDGDRDIIAMGQSHYMFANDLTGPGTPELGSITIYYIENNNTVFTLEDSEQLTNVFYNNYHWYYFNGKFDMACGDFDNDNDIDTVVEYDEDTNGNAANMGERVQVMGVYFQSGSLSSTSLATHSISNAWVWGNIVAADFNGDSYDDIIYSYGGSSGNPFSGGLLSDLKVQYLKNNLGSFLPSQNVASVSGGGFGALPYSMDVGHFSGASNLDVAFAMNYNADAQYGRDGKIYILKQKPDKTFTLANSGNPVFVEYGRFQHRGMAAGNLNNDDETGDDLICFTKFNDGGYDSINNFGVSYLRGQADSYPPGFSLGRFYTTLDGKLSATEINGIALGNFDNDADGFDDIVYVGNNVTVGAVTYPANLIPEFLSDQSSIFPSPALNNNNQAVRFNLTVKDMDGNWDIDRLAIDFTEIGMGYRNFSKPTYYNVDEKTWAHYAFTKYIPESVPEGDYDIPVTMYDTSDGGQEPKSTDTFLFRVKQYNRIPIIALENNTVHVMEDTVTYIEGVYDWFYDADMTPMDIKIRNPSDVWIDSIETSMFTAELVNGTEDIRDLSMKITPEPDENHKLSGPGTVMKMKAVDTVNDKLESTHLEVYIKIIPVNDLPQILPQGRPDADFSFDLVQDDHATIKLMATDPSDGDEGGSFLKFYLEYEDESVRDWLSCTEGGMLTWTPGNDNVGDHKVTLWVQDSHANISQVLWFNVTNIFDNPYFISVSNGTELIELPRSLDGMRYEFIVYEHEEFNLTIVTEDPDRVIGNQSMVTFQCNLTLGQNAYLDISEEDLFTANLHFWAEKRYGFTATDDDEHEHIETEILLVDQWDPDRIVSLPIRIIIINVNDAPLNVSIDRPADGEEFPILYQHRFSAGSVMDPDLIYGDIISYYWDFDASDGFQVEDEGSSVVHDFDQAGTFIVTLRVVDSGNNTVDATVTITVNGEKNPEDWDNDGMPNGWEEQHNLDPLDPYDASANGDDDDWTNLEEYLNGTDPLDSDSDNDGVVDSDDPEPLNPAVFEDKVQEEGPNIWPIVVGILVFLIILIAVLVIYVVSSRKKAEEEEEKRKAAEALQASMYEQQDLYAELPTLQQAPPLAQPLPQEEAPKALPSAPEADVFGGAGVLPSQPAAPAPEGAQPESLPPAAAAPAPPAPAAPQAPPPKGGPEVSDDLSDLFG